jgi:hypothetical protein
VWPAQTKVLVGEIVTVTTLVGGRAGGPGFVIVAEPLPTANDTALLVVIVQLPTVGA